MIAFSYTWAIKKIIKALKYRHTRSVASLLWQKLTLLIATTPFANKTPCIITYAPIHRRKKHMIRWYNQAELLAKSITDSTTIELRELFWKRRWTRSQTRFARNKRAKNIADSFTVTPATIPKNTTVIIVDDVCTTWSTLQELAKILKEKHPTITVYWLVAARRW